MIDSLNEDTLKVPCKLSNKSRDYSDDYNYNSHEFKEDQQSASQVISPVLNTKSSRKVYKFSRKRRASVNSDLGMLVLYVCSYACSYFLLSAVHVCIHTCIHIIYIYIHIHCTYIRI